MSTREWRNPYPTVDIIIEHASGGIVFIKRKNPPHGWALPGGFVDEGEPVHAAARREALEETSLEVELVEQFFCYSEPARDPRHHTLSVVFIARASGTPRAADDASELVVVPRAQIPSPLAFDHATILSDYFTYKDSGRRPPATR